MDHVELLAPAGGWEALKAAVSNGADAVYFGTSGGFNARKRAENFKEKELSEVAGYCHKNGVRAYLAANTLVKNRELDDYFSLLSNAYSSGIDAFIIQDISFIGPARKAFPDAGIHVSTQACVFNSLYGRLITGADRVILPREYTLSQVKEFGAKTGLGVEVFVHGALCFSISGQCLFSSFLGGRSGNRGLCAQPCRKRYNGRYLLSTRDLCLVEKIPELVKAGVSSLKIEGRLRDAEYVAAATSLYRRAIDSYHSGDFRVDKGALADAELAYSREHTTGMIGRVSEVSTPDAGGKRGIFLGVVVKGGLVRLNESVRIGDGVGVYTGTGSHGDLVRSIETNGRKVSSAAAGETVGLFLNAKEGDRIFLTSGAQRRNTYRFSKKAPIAATKRTPGEVVLDITERSFTEKRILVKAYSVADALAAVKAGAHRAYYNVFSKDYPLDEKSVHPYVPRCLTEWNAVKAKKTIEEIDPDSVLSGDAGLACSLKGREVFLDSSGNVFNDVSVSFYNTRGIIPVVSPELSFAELAGFKDKRFCVYAHGRIPLMSTKYALDDSPLRDEKGYVFPVRTESDLKQVLNSVRLGLFGSVQRLAGSGINYFLLDLEDDVIETVKEYKRILAGSGTKRTGEGYTLGNYRKGVL